MNSEKKSVKSLFSFNFLLNLSCSALLILSFLFAVNRILLFEFKDLRLSDSISLLTTVLNLSLILPFFACLLNLKFKIGKISISQKTKAKLLKKFSTVTSRTMGIFVALITLGIFYPSIPSISNYEKPYQETLEKTLEGDIFHEVWSNLNAGNYDYIDTNFISGSFSKGDMVFKVNPSYSLQSNINLEKNGEYGATLLENKFMLDNTLIDYPINTFSNDMPHDNCNKRCDFFETSKPYSVKWEYKTRSGNSKIHFSSYAAVTEDMCFFIDISFKDLDGNITKADGVLQCVKKKGSLDAKRILSLYNERMVDLNGSLLHATINSPDPDSEIIIVIKPRVNSPQNAKWFVNNAVIKADLSGKGQINDIPCVEGYHLANSDYIVHTKGSSLKTEMGSCR